MSKGILSTPRWLKVLVVYFCLRLSEFLFGALVLAAFVYFDRATPLAADVAHMPRFLASLTTGAMMVVAYYFFTGYFFISSISFFAVALAPDFSLWRMAGLNAGAFFTSGWLFALFPLIFVGRSIFLLWYAVLIFNALSPFLFFRKFSFGGKFGSPRINHPS